MEAQQKITEAVEEFLSRHGWLKSVAGEHDYDLAVKAVSALCADRSKWLMLLGGAGTGKTMLAKALCSNRPTAFFNCLSDENVDYLVPEGDKHLNGGVYSSTASELFAENVLLDDLGVESIKSGFKGEYNRCARFITRYYERGKGRLLITSNLGLGELTERYGTRVLDRIADRAIIVVFSGRSKRTRTILK